jgi:TRAP-type mannitol/chloroaromatic compound transport system substrate-binding protein
MPLSRKDFFKGLAVGTIAAPVAIRGLMGKTEAQPATEGPAVLNGRRYEWKMVTTWPPNFPILGEGCIKLADMIRTMSGGRINITVYGGGELVPALEAFDAVRTGAADMGSGAAYYWAGKAPAAQFFASFPYGFNAQQLNAWLMAGGGMKLWEELYAGLGLVPFIGGNTGVQMGGWFNRSIDSVADFQGLKMRIPGLAGSVLERLGGSPVLLAGGEIYTGLERGIIDATEWVGPYHDYLMGFHEIAKYYYYPGWHEWGTAFEFFVNKKTFDALPKDLQAIVRYATDHINSMTLARFEAENAIHLAKIRELDTVEIRPFPPEVLERVRQESREVVEAFADSDPFARRVYDSILDFRRKATAWAGLTEAVYYDQSQRIG